MLTLTPNMFKLAVARNTEEMTALAVARQTAKTSRPSDSPFLTTNADLPRPATCLDRYTRLDISLDCLDHPKSQNLAKTPSMPLEGIISYWAGEECLDYLLCLDYRYISLLRQVVLKPKGLNTLSFNIIH